jgi:hypothetical protein
MKESLPSVFKLMLPATSHGLLTTDPHRNTQIYLSSFIACRLYEELNIRQDPDVLAEWGNGEVLLVAMNTQLHLVTPVHGRSK